ncbi:MAG: hypothetical protein RJB15_1671 [Pseudomonadota bacterium]
MNRTQTQRLFTVISGLWVGAFISIGFLVVPVIFMAMGDRQVAGLIAGNLFKLTAYISVGVCGFLMVMANHLVKSGIQAYRLVRWLLLLMLVCGVLAAFVIIPWMNGLRDQALLHGISARETNNANLFGLLHSLSSIIFMIQSILGIGLVWQSTKYAD